MPPTVVAVLVPLLEQVARFLNQVAAPMLVQAADQMRQVLPPASEWVRRVGPGLIELALVAKRATAEVAFANWDELDTEDEWLAALRLVQADDGVPLAWVPPGAVVKALVAAADHDARDEVLLAHAPQIEVHARTVLDCVQHPDLRTLRAGIEQGWDAFARGLHMAAQATAGSAVGEILRQRGNPDFAPFKREWKAARESDPLAWGLDELRLKAVMVAVSTAIQDDRSVLTLRGFNRHAIAHGMRTEHYSEVNAVRGLMLVTSAARELQFVLSDEWMQPREGPLPNIRIGRIAAAERVMSADMG